MIRLTAKPHLIKKEGEEEVKKTLRRNHHPHRRLRRQLHHLCQPRPGLLLVIHLLQVVKIVPAMMNTPGRRKGNVSVKHVRRKKRQLKIRNELNTVREVGRCRDRDTRAMIKNIKREDVGQNLAKEDAVVHVGDHHLVDVDGLVVTTGKVETLPVVSIETREDANRLSLDVDDIVAARGNQNTPGTNGVEFHTILFFLPSMKLWVKKIGDV